VDEMVANAPAGMLDRWRRFYEQEPFGDPYYIMSKAAVAIVNELRELKYSIKNEKVPPKEVLKEDYFVPKPLEEIQKQKKPVLQMTGEAIMNAFRRR
jgi:hypothetical protein